MTQREWIQIPIKEGIYTKQAHCDLPKNTYERELGREGFYGPVTHMIHKHPPTSWLQWEGELRPRAFKLTDINATDTIPWCIPSVLKNQDVSIRLWKTEKSMQTLVRNSDGDELIFIHKGEGDFFCDYGHLKFCKGDYLLIPKGTAWRVEIKKECQFLMIENVDGAYQLPNKGMLGPQAIFDTAVLEHPKINDTFKEQQTDQKWSICIKRLNQLSRVTFPFNPLDAIGWHGTNSVFKLNVKDIRPITSHRYHLPPSVHTTFLAKKFVVCTFCPRPIESDPGALKVPFYHNNDDFDEVIFYHEGNFFSRDHIEKGMLTFHPCGFTHGPHPKALKKSIENPAKETNEIAVMIDTRHPLQVDRLLLTVEEKAYVNSWISPSKEN